MNIKIEHDPDQSGEGSRRIISTEKDILMTLKASNRARVTLVAALVLRDGS
jgi:hypothetical protein